MIDSLESLGYLLEGTLKSTRKGIYLATDKGDIYLKDVSRKFLGKDVRITLVDLAQAEHIQEELQRLSYDDNTLEEHSIPSNMGSNSERK